MSSQNPKGAIVFDTNAYRMLVETLSISEAVELGDQLHIAARNHGYLVMGSLIVAIELLEHVLREEDPVNESCRRSLALMGPHCVSDRTKDGDLTSWPTT